MARLCPPTKLSHPQLSKDGLSGHRALRQLLVVQQAVPMALRMVGQSRGQIQPVGDTAVLSYIIIRAAKSSSKRRNCQNKGCQSNFNSTSWQICLLMGSLITSSQPTFSSTRLLLYSGHDGQTAINEGPVNILFCPFFIQCVAPGTICHMPSNPCS